jgi:hypothetical protein
MDHGGFMDCDENMIRLITGRTYFYIRTYQFAVRVL